MNIFLVAEIGINHNGDIDITKKLIDLAVECKFDAVKFQKRTIDKVYTQEVLDSLRESPWGTTQRDQKNGLEFNKENYLEIDNYCKSKNIHWYASAWDIDSQYFLSEFDCKYNKIASAMIVDKELMEIVAREKKHTFISTGMSTYDDIDQAIKIFKSASCSFELMHTNSTYPTDPKDVNLSCIKTLKERYKCDVGYSGHESGISISCAAAMMGISSLERHITLDRSMYGSDQAASLGPQGLRQLAGSLEKIKLAIGDGKKHFSDSEIEVAKKLRNHLDWKV
jgi:N-acetylneuraminate synthase